MIPAEVASLLAGFPELDADEQAFPLVTVDRDGYPHAALLSRSELEVTPSGEELVAVSRGRTTDANLERSGRATLLAVGGTAAHCLKLTLVYRVVAEGLFGYRFRAAAHKRDSIGVALTPIGFRPTRELAETEHWERTRRLLADLRHMQGSMP